MNIRHLSLNDIIYENRYYKYSNINFSGRIKNSKSFKEADTTEVAFNHLCGSVKKFLLQLKNQNSAKL